MAEGAFLYLILTEGYLLILQPYGKYLVAKAPKRYYSTRKLPGRLRLRYETFLLVHGCLHSPILPIE